MRYPLPAKQHNTRKLASTRRKRVRWMLSSFWLSCSSSIASCKEFAFCVDYNGIDQYDGARLKGISADFETGGNGGKLVVRRLRVSYQVIPAGKHLPAEIKTVVISNARLVCISGHPWMNRMKQTFYWPLGQKIFVRLYDIPTFEWPPCSCRPLSPRRQGSMTVACGTWASQWCAGCCSNHKRVLNTEHNPAETIFSEDCLL